MNYRSLRLFCLILVAALTSLNPPIRVHAAPRETGMQSASEIISRINAYRAQNGLYSYAVNQDLMGIAQAHSEYQASIGSVTHTGAGGTRPRDRASAAGYGDGATIWVSEIIYGGTQATVDTAMSWWKGSTIHNSSMLSSQYQEVGAGVASSGGMTYFTVVMGYVTGTPAVESDAADSSGISGVDIVPATPFNPVVKAEPREDGSVVHEVQAGQTLWTIAAVYEIPLKELLELNDLPRTALLHPGQELLIQPSQGDPSTPTPTNRPTQTPSALNRTPSPSITPLPVLKTAPPSGVSGSDADAQAPHHDQPSAGSSGGLTVIGAIAVGMIVLYGFFIVVAGSFRNMDDQEERAP